MPNGARNGMLATFFVLGMAFMGMLFFMIFPDVFEPERFRGFAVATISQAADSSSRVVEAPHVQETKVETEAEPVAKVVSTKRVEAVPKTPEIIQSEPPPPSERIAEAPAARALAPEESVLPKLVASVVVRNSSPGRMVFGRATLLGVPPAERMLPADPQCGSLSNTVLTTQFYRVASDGALGDVVVVVSEGLPRTRWAPAQQPRAIHAQGCFLDPYVSTIQVGQPLDLRNLDPILHTFHIGGAHGSKNREWNFTAHQALRPHEIEFGYPEEFVRVRCDIHNWMVAYVTVVEHPFFAVTGRDGKFEINGLPNGKYTLTATHRKAGRLKAQVMIGDEWSKEVNFAFVPSTETDSRK